MKIAILLYEGMTALDAIGPYDVLRQLPGAEVVFAEVPAADVLLVPGGFGQEQVMRDETTLKCVRAKRSSRSRRATLRACEEIVG
jgi:putative intracellular protease/amidase